MKKIIALTLLTATVAINARAHCQIPCGIYDDTARFTAMREHVTTIEKSINEVVRLSATEERNRNQLIRWVNNKEEHADQLTEIVTAYFLTQRIKATEPVEKYEAELKLLHGMMVQTMKAKQTTDLQHVEKLRELIDQFEHIYFGKTAAAPHTH